MGSCLVCVKTKQNVIQPVKLTEELRLSPARKSEERQSPAKYKQSNETKVGEAVLNEHTSTNKVTGPIIVPTNNLVKKKSTIHNSNKDIQWVDVSKYYDMIDKADKKKEEEKKKNNSNKNIIDVSKYMDMINKIERKRVKSTYNKAHIV